MGKKHKIIIFVILMVIIVGGAITLGILDIVENNKCVNNPPVQSDIEQELKTDIFKTDNVVIENESKEDSKIYYIVKVDNISYKVIYKATSNYFYGYSWKCYSYEKLEG